MSGPTRAARLLILLALGCGADAGEHRADAAGLDAGPDTADVAPGDASDRPDGATEAPPSARACTSNTDCSASELCGLGSKTCVPRVKAVTVGTNHSCAVHLDGRVTCWGYGRFIGPGLPAVVPPRVIEVGGPAVSVEVGIQAACAVLESGGVSCWGDLTGDGAEAPGPVVKEDGTPLSGIKLLAGGSLAFCGGSPLGIFCWGNNKAGELARPPTVTLPPRTAVLSDSRPRPLLTATVAIITHDGTDEICGWGNNDSGILPGERGLVEKPRCGGGVGSLHQISAGDGHICGRRGGAMFTCWGSNSGGQLGIGDDGVLDVEMPGTPRALPATIVGLVSAAYHTCAVVQTGAVYCWGSNEHGEVGLAPSAPVFSPRLVEGFAGKVVALGAGAGAQHTCALLEDGQVQCWGYDNAGQLGAATTEDADRISATPVTVRF